MCVVLWLKRLPICQPAHPPARTLIPSAKLEYQQKQRQLVAFKLDLVGGCSSTIFSPEQLKDTENSEATSKRANKQTSFVHSTAQRSLCVWFRDNISSIVYVVVMCLFFNIAATSTVFVVVPESWSTKFVDAIFTSHFHLLTESKEEVRFFKSLATNWFSLPPKKVSVSKKRRRKNDNYHI